MVCPSHPCSSSACFHGPDERTRCPHAIPRLHCSQLHLFLFFSLFLYPSRVHSPQSSLAVFILLPKERKQDVDSCLPFLRRLPTSPSPFAAELHESESILEPPFLSPLGALPTCVSGCCLNLLLAGSLNPCPFENFTNRRNERVATLSQGTSLYGIGCRKPGSMGSIDADVFCKAYGSRSYERIGPGYGFSRFIDRSTRTRVTVRAVPPSETAR